MNAKHFAWVYLINHGMAGEEPSYYGGTEFHESFDFERYSISSRHDLYNNKGILRQKFVDEFRSIGVDWKNTKSPSSSLYSEFEGTFHDSTEKEYLTGELVLNDGSKQFWAAKALEVQNVFAMMESVSEGPEAFNKIFGDK
jgi:hypothetical protein